MGWRADDPGIISEAGREIHGAVIKIFASKISTACQESSLATFFLFSFWFWH